jgi:hypothetical protein
MKTIGIIGSAAVGKALAAGFLKHGYQVMIGSRDPAGLKQWQQESAPAVKTGTFDETAAFGEILVLCVKGTAGESALRLAGSENLKGKTVIDATNPIDASVPPVNGVLSFYTTYKESLMERFQKQFPDARFVKAFNSIGSHLMVNPHFEQGKPTMFICGNDDSAKAETTEILDLFGFETEDCGKVEGARAIEPLCILWCIPGLLRNQWTQGFKLLK